MDLGGRERRRRWQISAGIMMLALALGTGCASNQKVTSTSTTTTAQYPDSTVSRDEWPSEETQTSRQKEVSTTTTATQQEIQPNHGGGIFDLIGSVLAFPFRLIAGIFEAVF